MLTRIGVTGGIASGKSEVCEQFRALGSEVLSADLIARQLTDSDPTIRKKIVSLFGPESYDRGFGLLNRDYVAQRVFADPKKLQSLNSIVHPAVLKRIDVEIGAVEKKTDARYIAIEAALMFESGLNDVVDYVLAVVAEEGVRIARSQNRDHLTEEQIRLRMARQLPLQETIERSDFILHNNGSLDSLQQKVRFFHSIFIALKPRPVRNHDHH